VPEKDFNFSYKGEISRESIVYRMSKKERKRISHSSDRKEKAYEGKKEEHVVPLRAMTGKKEKRIDSSSTGGEGKKLDRSPRSSRHAHEKEGGFSRYLGEEMRRGVAERSDRSPYSLRKKKASTTRKGGVRPERGYGHVVDAE